MTHSASKAPWPVAFACYLGGSAMTVALWLFAMYVAAHEAHIPTFTVQLFALGAIGLAVVVATRLPHRARAMFVAGALTPVALALMFVLWLIWAFAPSNFTF